MLYPDATIAAFPATTSLTTTSGTSTISTAPTACKRLQPALRGRKSNVQRHVQFDKYQPTKPTKRHKHSMEYAGVHPHEQRTHALGLHELWPVQGVLSTLHHWRRSNGKPDSLPDARWLLYPKCVHCVD